VCQALARTTFDIVGANAIEDVHIAVDGEREAVGLGDADFPDIAALRVALAFHLFCPQRKDV
jgi:hypothetical protein